MNDVERIVDDPDAGRDQYNQYDTWEENLRRILRDGKWRIVSASVSTSGGYPMEQKVELELVRVW